MKIWTRALSEERFPLPISPLGWSTLEAALNDNLEALASAFGLNKVDLNEIAVQIDFYVYIKKGFVRSGRKSILSLKLTSWIGLILRALSCWISITVSAPLNPAFLWWERIPLLGVHLSLAKYLAFAKSRKSSLGLRVRDPIYEFTRALYMRAMGRLIEIIGDQWEGSLAERHAKIKSLSKRFDDDQLRTRFPQGLSLPEFEEVLAQLQKESLPFLRAGFSLLACKLLLFSYLREWLKLTGVECNLVDLVSSLSESTDQKLLAALAEAQSAKDLATKVGHLTDNLDISAPTIGERTAWMNLLLEQGPSFYQRAKRASGVSDYIGIEQEIRVVASGFGESEFIGWLLIQFRRFAGFDEDFGFYFSYAYPAFRQLYMYLGEGFEAKGFLKEAKEIFFLSLDEIRSLLSANARFANRGIENKVTTRRLAFQKALTFSMPVEIPARDLKMQSIWGYARTSRVKPYSERVFRGNSAYAGQVEGPVSVIRSFQDWANVKKGDIVVMVAPSAAYCAFYPLAAGIVFETGHELNHGIVAARRQSIPTLTGAKGILNAIKTGDRVFLDATSGEIRLLNSNSFARESEVTASKSIPIEVEKSKIELSSPELAP